MDYSLLGALVLYQGKGGWIISSLREIKAAMPADFVATYRNTAETLGMTHRILAVTCIALGYKLLFHINEGSHSLPSEPPHVPSDEIAEKEVGPRVAVGDGAKRNLPYTLKAAFGAITRNKRGTAV